MTNATYAIKTELTDFNIGTGMWTTGTDTVANQIINDQFDNNNPKLDLNEGGWVDENPPTGSTMILGTYTGWHVGTAPIMQETSTGNFFILNNEAMGTYASGGSATSASQFTLCFLENTLIDAADGEVAVESLAIGDEVCTASGDTAKVKFVFKNTIEFMTPFQATRSILPVTIMAGALGENVPAQDLKLSPDHALLVDGCLVEARLLINGASIYQEARFEETITYYHVEMENHELIVANGTVAESFIDNVSRSTFDNFAEYQALYPNEVDMAELEYPRVKSARQLPKAIAENLAARSEMLVPGGIRKTA